MVLNVREEAERFKVVALGMGNRRRLELWEDIFLRLTERGLNREAVALGMMDRLPSLKAAFRRFIPRARTQRCQEHANPNVCRKMRKREREGFSKGINKIFHAPNEVAALPATYGIRSIIASWSERSPFSAWFSLFSSFPVVCVRSRLRKTFGRSLPFPRL